MISAQFGTSSRWQYSHNITNTSQSGPMGLFAVHIIKPDETEEINYIHKDHTSTSLSTGLGSWNTITDESGNKLQELSFDACSVKPDFCESSEAKTLVEPISAEARGREGNRRDPATWRAIAGTPPEPLFDRGFTGHEHLYAVNLINMNGRVYDPIVSRMLSPDNFIQAPGYSQSLNRYSYCWNNPLKYTDPTGQELGVENNRKFFWWTHRGDSYSSYGIGPGSNNHWSDPYRDKDGDFMLMTSRVFDNKHGHGAWDNYFKEWNKHAGFEVNRKYIDKGVEISYSGGWVSHSTSYYGAENVENGSAGGGDNIFSDWWNSHWTAKFIPDVIYLNVGVVVTTSIGYGYNWGYALQIRGKEGFGIRPFVTFTAKYGTHGAIGLNLGYSSYSGDSRNFSFHDSFYGEGTIASEVDYIYGIGASQSPLDNYGGVLRSYDLGMGYGIGASYNFFTGTSPY